MLDFWCSPLIYVVFIGITVSAFWLRSNVYPKPIPGIPYHKTSTSNILGDFPSLIKHFKKYHTNFDWMAQQCIDLNSPIVQLFLQPFRAPFVVIADHWEGEDILIRRTSEFGRSHFFSDIFAGAFPNGFINMPTDHVFMSARRVWSDLMTSSFLNETAGPLIFYAAEDLLNLLAHKAELAQNHPFEIGDDIKFAMLDAIWHILCGTEVGTTKSQIQALAAIDKINTAESSDEVVRFPEAPVPKRFKAVQTIAHGLEAIISSPVPRLYAKLTPYLPSQWSAYSMKKEVTNEVVTRALEKVRNANEGQVEIRSGIELAVLREVQQVRKNGSTITNREIQASKDNLFGLLIGAHDTTSAALTVGLKYLANNAISQTDLRRSLQESLPNNASPTDITKTNIPLLDATIQEILRLAQVAQGINRVALVDTEVLGHRIPKGTIVWCMPNGPSYLSPRFSINDDLRSPTSYKGLQKTRPWSDDDIAEFQPKRWLVEDAEKKNIARYDVNRGPSIPFSSGNRGCFGKKMAYIQLRIFLALLILNFEFCKVPKRFDSYASVQRIATEPVSSYVRLKPLVRV